MAAKGKEKKRKDVHETFDEKDDVLFIIGSLKEAHKDMIKLERAIEKFTLIVDEYQEQPHMIDPHLEEIINSIIDRARQPDCEDGHMYALFTCMHLLTKMRGYKVIVRYLPHEVSDVETVLELLTKQNPHSFNTWQNRYCLLLWLSMVSMIPFDLVRLDNTEGGGDNKLPVMDRILNLGKLYLFSTDKSCDAAAYMLAKFLTRPDVKEKKLPEVMDWAFGILQQCCDEKYFMTQSVNAKVGGTLKMLALLFKNGKREDLIPYAGRLLDFSVRKIMIGLSPNIIIRKLGVKLIQRIGLIYLKAKVASWRYSRGSRSLADNLRKVPATSVLQTTKSTEEEDDEEYDIPDEIEEVIEHLLKNLKDKDTIVRWSAAKGIGRITARLPRDLAEDVIGSLLQLFTLQESDGAWHGGCLSLAELGRRGLLLPQLLPEVIPVIITSLNYDEKRGNYSVGSHVRDSACYVCWSFARAYEPEIMKPYVIKIASALIVAAVFDREVNVRRAASAAFQENVGRQGTFPHGIDIVTTCDYFAVGLRSNCYMELSKFVAGFAEYTHPIIDHLIDYKIKHWDVSMRDIAASALSNLVPLDTDYFSQKVLPKLIPMATGTDINARYGAHLAIGKVCLALKSNSVPISEETLTDITQIEPKLRERRQLLGTGGEMMRVSLCSMINDLSAAKLFSNHSVVATWQKLLDECLGYTELTVQRAAINALNSFFRSREDDQQQVAAEVKESVIQDYIDRMTKASLENIRIGCTLALGALPKSYLEGNLNKVLGSLIYCCKVTDGDSGKDWAESRRDAFKSIDQICETVGVDAEGSPQHSICRDNIDDIYGAYLIGLEDYTIDSRGDAGAWVREACMVCIQTLTASVVVTAPDLLNRQLIETAFKKITQQACEKIDRTRDQAGLTLINLLYSQPEVPHIPCRQSLKTIFPKAEADRMSFASPSLTFPRFSKLLDMEEYRYNILLGMTVSVGGLTESLVKHSYMALSNHLQLDQQRQAERVRNLCETVIQIFNRNHKQDRVTVPLLKMNAQLLGSGVFEEYADDEKFEFPMQLLDCIKAEISKSGDPQKLLVSSEVLCGLLMFDGPIREKCLFQLAIFLCHRFPIVRKTTANSLFESMMTNDIVEEEKSEQVMSLLTDTEWSDDVAKLRPVRNEICGLLGINTPTIIKKKPKEDGDGSSAATA